MALHQQLIPPFRYAIVEDSFFRGAYPTIKNFRFLRRLHLKTIVSLTPETEPNRDLHDFCRDEGIGIRQFFVEKFQDGVTLSNAKVIQILQIIINPENLPLFLHCLDGSHVCGLVVMCFRKLQSWNLSMSTAEFCKFQREGEISREESQFVEAFRGEIEVPPTIPSWLWQGVRNVKHPSFRLRLLPSPATTDEMGDDGGGTSNGRYSDSTVVNSDRLIEGLGRRPNPPGKVSHRTAGLLPATGAGSSSGAVGAIYGDVETEERIRFAIRSGTPTTGSKGNSRGTILYRSPRLPPSNKQDRFIPQAVAVFPDADNEDSPYSKVKHNLEALALEGLRLTAKRTGLPPFIPSIR